MMCRLLFTALMLVVLPHAILAEEEKPDLDKIEMQLTAMPDDPALNASKCQALFVLGKEQEAIDHAQVAMSKYIAAKDKLDAITLGSFTTDKYKVDVRFNMGSKERAEKRDGIVRPYSFRVFTKDSKPKLVRTIDFEYAYFEENLLSAAVGEMRGGGHANYGILDAKSDFTIVKNKVLKVIEK
jgi:hypothetical protein